MACIFRLYCIVYCFKAAKHTASVGTELSSPQPFSGNSRSNRSPIFFCTRTSHAVTCTGKRRFVTPCDPARSGVLRCDTIGANQRCRRRKSLKSWPSCGGSVPMLRKRWVRKGLRLTRGGWDGGTCHPSARALPPSDAPARSNLKELTWGVCIDARVHARVVGVLKALLKKVLKTKPKKHSAVDNIFL